MIAAGRLSANSPTAARWAYCARRRQALPGLPRCAGPAPGRRAPRRGSRRGCLQQPACAVLTAGARSGACISFTLSLSVAFSPPASSPPRSPSLDTPPRTRAASHGRRPACSRSAPPFLCAGSIVISRSPAARARFEGSGAEGRRAAQCPGRPRSRDLLSEGLNRAPSPADFASSVFHPRSALLLPASLRVSRARPSTSPASRASFAERARAREGPVRTAFSRRQAQLVQVNRGLLLCEVPSALSLRPSSLLPSPAQNPGPHQGGAAPGDS